MHERDRQHHACGAPAAPHECPGRLSRRRDSGRGRLGAADRPVVPVLRRRPGAFLRRDDPRHRAADRRVRPLLSEPAGSDGTVLRLPAPVPGSHARHRTQRQRSPAGDLLGTYQPELVPADRLLAPSSRRPPGCPDGARRHRRWRPSPDGRHAAPRTGGRIIRADRDPRTGRHHPGVAALCTDPPPGARRRLHEIGAVPVPFLAAARDGGADPGLGLPPFGDDGEGGHIPARAAMACPRGDRAVVPDRHPDRPRHHGGRRLDRPVQGRSEGNPRLFDREPPRAHDHAARFRHTARRGGLRVPHPEPRNLQGGPLHERRHRRSRDRFSGHPSARRPHAADADQRDSGPDRHWLDGWAAAAQRLPVEGNDAGNGVPHRLCRQRLGGPCGGHHGRAPLGSLLRPPRLRRLSWTGQGRLPPSPA